MTIESLVRAGSTFLFWHFLILGLCVTGLLSEKILRSRNAHARSALLRSTLAIVLTLPLACVTWRAWPALPTATAPSATLDTQARIAGIDWGQVAVWRPLVTDLEKVPENLLPVKTSHVALGTMAVLSFLGISLLVSTALLVRFVIALFRGSALRRRGRPLAPADGARYRAIAAAMDVAEPPALMVEGLESPILLGFFRPVILLPAGMAPRDEIFSHELTHLRRHDLKWHLLAHLAVIALPLQPGFWLLKKALERADEDVCDDTVLVRGADAAAYADLLLHVAESQRAPNPELCLPMAAFRTQLERRLHRLLDATRPLARHLSFSTLCLGLGPLLVSGILAGVIFLDGERPAAAADSDPARAKASPGAQVMTLPISSITNSSLPENDDPRTLENQLLNAQQDAAKRRMLYDLTKTMPDDEIVDTLAGMQRVTPTLTTVENDFLQKQAERQRLLAQGFVSQNSRVQAVDAELKVERERYEELVLGARNALKIDAEMAAAGVKLLQDKVNEQAAQTDGKQETDEQDLQLLEAVKNGDMASLQRLFDQGLDPDAKKSNPVYWAIYYGEAPILKMLLDHGAIANQWSPPGDVSPMELARKKHPELISMLQAGMDRNRQIQIDKFKDRLAATRIDLPAFSNEALDQVMAEIIATIRSVDPQDHLGWVSSTEPAVASARVTMPVQANVPASEVLDELAKAAKVKIEPDEEFIRISSAN